VKNVGNKKSQKSTLSPHERYENIFFQVNDPKHFRILRLVLCHTRVGLEPDCYSFFLKKNHLFLKK